jgi:hypothetical protein
MRWLISKLTMKRQRYLFTDKVDGQSVFLYTDYYGDEWMANWNHWFYRVKKGDK